VNATPKLTDGALSVFQFDAWRVRILDRDGEPWWVLRDVCEALEIAKPENVAPRLADDEKGTCPIGTPGGPQNMTIINESGLYAVILRSDKPEAKRFKTWITHEVLPSLRKTGAYSTFTIPKSLPEALRLAADLEEERAALESKVAVLEPKAAVADMIAGAEGLKTLSEVGKITNLGPRRIIDALLNSKVLYRQGRLILPKQEHIEAGRFVVKDHPYEVIGKTFVYSQTLVTGKGETWIAEKYGRRA